MEMKFIPSNYTKVSSSTGVVLKKLKNGVLKKSKNGVLKKSKKGVVRQPKSSQPTIESTSTKDSPKQLSPRKPRIKKWKSSEPHPIVSFPPELFINILYFCNPQTLLSLSKVCRQFAMYLNASDSSITTKIWRDSRKGFLNNLKLDPPEGMTEKEYCKLSVERGCMVCGIPRIRKVYWAFRVRCCTACLEKMTISDYRIESELGIPSCVLFGLPYVQQQKWARRRGSFIVRIYLVKQVKDAHKEYKEVPAKERKDWYQRMKIQGIEIMKEVNQRMNDDSNKRMKRLAKSINQIRSINPRSFATITNQSKPSIPEPKDCSKITPNYAKLVENLSIIRKRIFGDQPLTLSEKILYAHLWDPKGIDSIVKGETYLKLKPDRVAMQDASSQTAILQFMLAKMPVTAVPTSIHCDHLIEAYEGGDKDLKTAEITSKEIFDFLKSASDKYGIEFWKPGSGIIHQIVLENYAAPGALMIGTDSHTPNAGGLGTIAIGVGGADAVDAMANVPWELKAPKIIGVKLIGKLNEWTSPKDVILHLAGKLTVRGGTGHIIEYFGTGIETLSCTGMATICNMGAEVGATTSVFPFTSSMYSYLSATRRYPVAEQATSYASYLKADSNAHYDQIIEINLSELEPHINGPFTPDLSTPLSKFADFVTKNGWKDEIKAGLIGSCTNSSYQDMSRVTSLVSQALDKGIHPKSDFYITPGSDQIRATMERDGQTEILQKVGGRVLANACGPCIGQWKRTDIQKNEENAILTSFNRNFKNRNDGNPSTMNFLASPEVSRLTFNPVTDTLVDKDGKPFRFSSPFGDELPKYGFERGKEFYEPSPVSTGNPSTQITIPPNSDRIQLLEPFPIWHGSEFHDLRVLIKVKGKCTTDHISAAGPWLRFKGHLENISNNTLIGALNADNGKVNLVRNVLTEKDGTIPEVARYYKENNIQWIVVADHNYGEGSAREHAALQVRYLGCPIIIAKSFARIHETNLKKQGVLPLVFKNEDDYNLLSGGDIISTIGVVGLEPGKDVTIRIRKEKSGGKIEEFDIVTKHTMSENQIEWFVMGSALNLIASMQKSNSI
ncbi:23167_t:CDS:10 [Cetraspora pellucida]|uniref:23167_t:CDS:1 n=1 Tax=Cetraspora pellucida TaxID=1433469 RepID=A0A9N9C2V6_9GLOM|nr:23167_t:CDS:10 [Cetraspora pellucida]